MRCSELLRASRWLLRTIPPPAPILPRHLAAASAPRSAVAELGVVRRLTHAFTNMTRKEAALRGSIHDLQQAAADAQPPKRTRLNTRIMYIECQPQHGRTEQNVSRKAGRLIGDARIGRVTFSRTGCTLYYRDQRFQSLKGAGFKSNYFDVETGENYWISGPKRDGSDRLYGERIPVEIDEDAREEYWTDLRRLPENTNAKVA